MSIEAMKQALEALTFDGFTPQDVTHREMTAKAVEALRTAIQQAEAKTDEPIYQICKADSVSIHSAWVDVDKQAYDDAGLYPEYGRRMLYTPPRSWCAG